MKKLLSLIILSTFLFGCGGGGSSEGSGNSSTSNTTGGSQDSGTNNEQPSGNNENSTGSTDTGHSNNGIRLIKVKRIKPNNSSYNSTVEYFYDANGRVEKEIMNDTNSNQSRTVYFSYDNQNNLIKFGDNDSFETNFYYQNNRLYKRIDKSNNVILSKFEVTKWSGNNAALIETETYNTDGSIQGLSKRENTYTNNELTHVVYTTGIGTNYQNTNIIDTTYDLDKVTASDYLNLGNKFLDLALSRSHALPVVATIHSVSDNTTTNIIFTPTYRNGLLEKLEEVSTYSDGSIEHFIEEYEYAR